jgi:hypothetical protein
VEAKSASRAVLELIPAKLLSQLKYGCWILTGHPVVIPLLYVDAMSHGLLHAERPSTACPAKQVPRHRAGQEPGQRDYRPCGQVRRS